MEETVPCYPWSDFLPRRTTTIVHISRPNMNLKLHLKMAFETKQKSRDNITVLLFILLFRQTNTWLWTYLLCYYSTVVFPQKWIRMTNVCKVNVAEIWMWCLKFEMKCLPEAVQAKKKKTLSELASITVCMWSPAGWQFETVMCSLEIKWGDAEGTEIINSYKPQASTDTASYIHTQVHMAFKLLWSMGQMCLHCSR